MCRWESKVAGIGLPSRAKQAAMSSGDQIVKLCVSIGLDAGGSGASSGAGGSYR
jgi:hypothetical protein